MSHYNPFPRSQTMGALEMAKLHVMSLNAGFCIWTPGIAEKVLNRVLQQESSLLTT